MRCCRMHSRLGSSAGRSASHVSQPAVADPGLSVAHWSCCCPCLSALGHLAPCMLPGRARGHLGFMCPCPCHSRSPFAPFIPAGRCARLKTDFYLAWGEVAAALLRVCKYALSALDVHDIVFGAWAPRRAVYVGGWAGPAAVLAGPAGVWAPQRGFPSSPQHPRPHGCSCPHPRSAVPGRHLQPGAAPCRDAGGGRDSRHARALSDHAQVAALLLQRGHGRLLSYQGDVCQGGRLQGALPLFAASPAGAKDKPCARGNGGQPLAQGPISSRMPPTLTPTHFCRCCCRQVDNILELKADSDSTRPAYAVGVDHKARQVSIPEGCIDEWSGRSCPTCECSHASETASRLPHIASATQVVLAFRGTTDLNDMLTDACATW